MRLQRDAYAGLKDWIIIAWLESFEAQRVEMKLQSTLVEYKFYASYIKSTGFVEYPSGVGAVSGGFSLPGPGHKFFDAIDLVIWQALENPCEPRFGIDVVHLGGFHEGVGDGGCLSAAD